MAAPADDRARTESPAASVASSSASPANSAAAEVGPRSSCHGHYAFPDFLHSVKLKYVKLGYHYLIQHALYLHLIPLSLAIADGVPSSPCGAPGAVGDDVAVQPGERHSHGGGAGERGHRLLHVQAIAGVHAGLRVLQATEAGRVQQWRVPAERSVELQRKVCERSGLGEETSLPPAVMSETPNPCMEEARREAEMVMFTAIDALLQRTGINPKEIGVHQRTRALRSPSQTQDRRP